ncbi:GNAT family N-acetyltransferase [Virgibacillus siamensis]|uniref:GNAT family N-acetyltransferase n=1 Tax=Virgibacillus siamensis TaxID=480071 RepID=UPI0009857C5A|nr:GNAT family N-acetyltransferase [Virgibacillus siamensis]
MQTIQINELQTDEEIMAAFPVMRQLRKHLDEPTYLDLVQDAMANDHYRMFALYMDNQLAAVVGFKPMITLYYGRFVWVCDLVTDAGVRSNGHGERLLSFVHTWAEEHNYESVALSSGLQREDAHRFYEKKMDYAKVSYVFRHSLTEQ